jgi:hypothetical protein
VPASSADAGHGNRRDAIVEAAVEFAKAGTDPRPEDALKNIYVQ